MALIVVFLHRPLLSLFVDKEESIQAGYTRMSLLGYFYILNFTMNISAAILRGLKHSTYPMITTLLTCTVLRIVLILTVFPLETFHTVFWLYALFPITWVIATTSNLIAISIFLPKDLRCVSNNVAELKEANS